MITLKLNRFSEKEAEKLAELLCNMEQHMIINHCKGQQCPYCDYRHLCYDIKSAKGHAHRLAGEKRNEKRFK